MGRLLAGLIGCALLLWTGCSDTVTGEITDLSMNYHQASVCVESETARLGWAVENLDGKRQTDYQLQVATTPAFRETDLIYQTGVIASTASQNVRPSWELPASAALYWRVRVWSDAGEVTPWSEPYAFFTAPEWEAKWITTRSHEVSTTRRAMPTFGQQGRTKNPEDSTAVYFARSFSAAQPIQKAHLYITGLGYYDLTVNGNSVGGQVLDPAYSDYQKTVFYRAFDVGEYLQEGKNDLLVTLGNGFYNLATQNLFMFDLAEWKAPHKLLLQLHLTYEDGNTATIISDDNWQWGRGPIVFNSIMGGETYDARQEIRTDQPVHLSVGPGGALVPQLIPPMAVNQEFAPRKVTRLDATTQVVDFGENITGSVTLNLPAMPAGQTVRLFYNEAVDDKGYLQKDYSKTHTIGRFQQDIFISNGRPTTFANRFSYFGFRYVQVEGYPEDLVPEDITARSIHTTMEHEGVFRSSNERLNQLQAAITRTLKNSIHGMPGEEPTREKMGWTFDAGLNTMAPYLYNFNAVAAYEKYLRDLADAQAENGHIPPIVPTNGWGFLNPDGSTIQYDDPWWGGTILYVMDGLVDWTGDSTYYVDYYDHLKAYTDFVHSTADSNLVVSWSLGDWLDPEMWKYGWGPWLTRPTVTSTLGLYDLARGTSRIAEMLGKPADQQRYAALAEEVRQSFLAEVYNTTLINDSLSQTGHAVPLWLDVFSGATRDSVYGNLRSAIERVDNHIYSGFIGIVPIMETLVEEGDRQLAFDLIMQERSPGWLHMVRDEFSTMGENMNAEGYGTGHHPFATNIGYWFYRHILGLAPRQNGWQQFTLTPFLPRQLDTASGTVVTPYGACSVALDRGEEGITCTVSVPFNTEATIVLPEKTFTLAAGAHTFTYDE